MKNEEYVKHLIEKAANRVACLRAMEKYQENHWWEVGAEKADLAYYQMHERILLVEFHRFHEAVEWLLQRPVSSIEFDGEHLLREVRFAYRDWRARRRKSR